METKLQVFYNEESNVNIRTQVINGEPWFVAKDVCAALDITNPRDAIKKMLDDDERGVANFYTPANGYQGGGEQQLNVVNESGLYNLIFRSRKPEARAFRKWVTNEVLPSIRRTGAYGVEHQERKRLPLPKYRPFFDEWKQRVRPYISRKELEDVAKECVVTLSHVQKVYAGTSMSAPVTRIITEYAKRNRKHNVVYPEPQPVHWQMCIEWDE